MVFRFVIFVSVLLASSASLAQEETKSKNGELEIVLGLNFFGPAPQMARIMEDFHFDQTTQPYWGDRTKEHPNYPPFGGLFQLSYSHYLGQRSQLGIILHWASLRRVEGHHAQAEELEVRFSNTSIIATYNYDLNHCWEIQTGPAMMVNDSYGTYPDTEDFTDYTSITPGVFLGLSTRIWDSRVTYGKIGTHLLITGRVSTGPFTAESWFYETTATIPEHKLGYSHFNLYFAFGFHL